MTDTTTDIATIPEIKDIVPTDRRLLPAPIEKLAEVAKLIHQSGPLVSDELRNDKGACMAVAYMAALHGTDPIATASQVYMVNKRLAYMSGYINALIRRHVDEPLKIEYSGEGTNRRCRVTGRLKGIELEYVSPVLAVIHPKNSPLWKTDPDQQLSYYSIRAWSRRHMPDVMLGIYAVDELQALNVSITDVTKKADPFAEEEEPAPAPAEPEDAEIEEIEPEQAGLPLEETPAD